MMVLNNRTMPIKRRLKYWRMACLFPGSDFGLLILLFKIALPFV